MPKNVNNNTYLPNLTDARTEYSDAISDDTVRLALPRIIPDVVDNITGEAKLQVRPFSPPYPVQPMISKSPPPPCPSPESLPPEAALPPSSPSQPLHWSIFLPQPPPPPACLQVFFGEDEVTDGVEVSLAALAREPTIRISGLPSGSHALHTLVLVDPDMPSPNNPKYK